MTRVQMMRCDGCGKLAEPELELAVGWRRLPLPFSGVEVEVCSPGCAKRLVNDVIDQEWEGEAEKRVLRARDTGVVVR